MNLLLYPHRGSGNHGCEAIVRSTKKLLNGEIVLMTSSLEEDIRYGLNEAVECKVDAKSITRCSMDYYKALIQNRLFHNKDSYDILHFKPIFDQARYCDIALSIGGDNYCYGVPNYLYLINNKLRAMHIPTVLWGCSIEPNAIDRRMEDDLKGYTHIFARESITFNALLERGIKQVSLFPDPAFCLDRKDSPLPLGFELDNTVGINISPMILKHETITGVTMQNYRKLLEYILEETDMNIALIPHVVWPHNDDREPLKLLHNYYNQSDRVVMIYDRNAEELKGIISKWRFMIAARTHASIAAYSSGIPTLVIGYSIKARGIATDLFGTIENYVLPVQALRHDGQLVDSFKWLVENEDRIRGRSLSKLPDYIGKFSEIKREVIGLLR